MNVDISKISSVEDLFEKIDQLEKELELAKEVSKYMYKSLSEVMLVVETLSRLMVSKDMITNEEIKSKAKELDVEREANIETFKKSAELEARREYIRYLLSSGSYGNA